VSGKPGNPGLTPEQMLEALDAYEAADQCISHAAKSLGLDRGTYVNRLRKAQLQEREVLEAARAGGVSNSANLSHFWKIVKDDDGNGYSLFIRNPSGEDQTLADLVQRAIQDGYEDKPPKYPKRKATKGEHLLVIDLADVHFMKLCVKTETGYTYDRDVARHRVLEGTRGLLEMARGFGVGRILFVLGNDSLHVDNPKGTTTSGTHQDTDGSIFQGFSDARAAFVAAIEECAEVADVDLVHCMSNHDWVTGWTLSQCIAAHFGRHPNVHTSTYNLSEAHRKYYRFGSNLIGLTHGDGTKEEKLYGHIVTEARQHIGECRHVYWVCHHVHHKNRLKRGVDVWQTEKDHNGMTVLNAGAAAPEGTHVSIEYVRSPSPPDGWHDRNGYVNRQGVECFLFHPHEGQKARFTQWF